MENRQKHIAWEFAGFGLPDRFGHIPEHLKGKFGHIDIAILSDDHWRPTARDKADLLAVSPHDPGRN